MPAEKARERNRRIGSIGAGVRSSQATNAATSAIFAGAVSGYASSHPRGPDLQAAATVHGYTTAFWWAAGVFALGLLIALLVLPKHQGAPAAVAVPGAGAPAPAD